MPEGSTNPCYLGIVLVSLMSALLSGCLGPHHTLRATQGRTMQAIYTEAAAPKPPQKRFSEPPLPEQAALFIFPHTVTLADEALTMPGYTVQFPVRHPASD
jgi:hypothetical protein